MPMQRRRSARNRRMKLAVLFDNLGPYHIARLAALGSHCDLLVIEQHTSSAEYDWHPCAQVPFPRVTLLENPGVPTGSASELGPRAISEVLSGFGPDVIAVPGWAGEQAIFKNQTEKFNGRRNLLRCNNSRGHPLLKR